MNGILQSADKDLEEMRIDFEKRVRTFVDDMRGNVTRFLRSSVIRELRANASKVVSDIVDEAKKIADQSDQIESDLRRLIKNVLDDNFRKENPSLSYNQSVRAYRWEGNLEGFVRDLMKELGDLGKDQPTNTLSIYDLKKKIVEDVKALGNRALEDLRGMNYTVDDLEMAIKNAFMTNRGDEFDRHVIVHELSTMLDGLGELYGFDNVNTKKAITSATEWVDSRLADYSDGRIEKIPGTVFVAPLVMLDYVLGKVKYFLENKTHSVGRRLLTLMLYHVCSGI